jgi:hypothetical protein
VPGAWLTDADSAAAIAVGSGKDLLVDFASPASEDSTALDSELFRRAAAGNFVMVRLRSSADSPADIAARVAAWGERLGITQFPTFVLLDSHGRPYADAPGPQKDPATSVKLLGDLLRVKSQRDAEMFVAKGSASLDRAKHLDAALKTVGRFATGPTYVDVMREIISLDKENSAGLKAKYANVVAGIDIDAAIQSDVYPMIDKGDLAGAIARIDRIVAEAQPTSGQKQLLLAFKGQLYFSLHDAPNAAKAFDEALKIDPRGETAAKVLAARQQVMGGAS